MLLYILDTLLCALLGVEIIFLLRYLRRDALGDPNVSDAASYTIIEVTPREYK